MTRPGPSSQWLIQPDGSGLREVLQRGVWTAWSGDGRWLYYALNRNGAFCIEKVPPEGGPPATVRCDNAGGPAVAADGSTLYYSTHVKREGGTWDWEIRRASPENGPSQTLARIAGSRVPFDRRAIQPVLSPNGKWLALPLVDGETSNLWALSVDGGPIRQLTDFGGGPVVIARRLSWSPDGKHIYAAVAEPAADVVLLEGLMPKTF
jgi:Tol biopolymer transport system component